ncbi:MAG: DUF1893 domain-containing protein [Chloroflexota bacterium]
MDMDELYRNFLSGEDTLRVYSGGRLIFTSRKDRLKALLGYIDNLAPDNPGVTMMDRVVGNAAALLAIKAGCREIYSPLASRLACRTLDEHGVRYHFDQTVAYIRQADGRSKCPMERLSQKKEPEQFYALLQARTVADTPASSC